MQSPLEAIEHSDENQSSVAAEQIVCSACGQSIQAAIKFCPHCGRMIEKIEVHEKDALKTLVPTFLYYFSTLLLIAIFKFTPVLDDTFESLALISAIDVILVIGFWIYFGRSFRGLFSFQKVSIKVLSLVAIGSVAAAFIVSNIADLINLALNEDVFYDYAVFLDTPSPLLLAILFICVQPAIFEEVAFRGFLFNNIGQVTTPGAAVYITGFLFGILHLAIISLLWLVPIGLVFAWLRMRYDTLWYGIAGHFIYNFVITMMEYNTIQKILL